MPLLVPAGFKLTLDNRPLTSQPQRPAFSLIFISRFALQRAIPHLTRIESKVVHVLAVAVLVCSTLVGNSQFSFGMLFYMLHQFKDVFWREIKLLKASPL